MAEKSSSACAAAPGGKNGQDLAINNTRINRLFTRIALKTWGRLYKRRGVCIPISRKMIVKSSPWVDLTEAATMEFISKNTSIPVPKVYCSFVHKGCTYILMERMQGKAIGDALGSLGGDGQKKVLAQLKRMMDEMRSLPPAAGTGVQSCTGGSLWDSRISRISTRFGPFATIQEFHFWLRNGFRFDDLKHQAKFDERFSGQDGQDLADMEVMQDGLWPPPVFTHGDLNPSNILVRGEEVVAIIDWEFAGWYPHYWEYTAAWLTAVVFQDWRKNLPHFLTTFPTELAMEITRERWWGPN